MKLETYFLNIKILVSIALLGQGLYYSLHQPGIMDTVNAAIEAGAIYCIWFCGKIKIP